VVKTILVVEDNPDAREMVSMMPIVVMSAFGCGKTKDAIDAGANRSSPKPMHVDSLAQACQTVIILAPFN
jgi:hypothetical protein